MSRVENINPEKEPIPASWVPRVITGGKGPPDPPKISGDNWLKDLSVGTVFWARHNEKTVDWEEYYLAAKIDDNSFLLKVSVPDGKIWDRRIDPKLFCNYHRDYQVLWVHKQEETDDPEQRNQD